jgi:threonine synthase
MTNEKDSLNATTGNGVRIFQQCTAAGCSETYGIDEMLFKCTTCGGKLEYGVEGHFDGKPSPRDDQWKNFPLIPLKNPANIVSLDVGGSRIMEMEELNRHLNGAKLFVQLDSDKNPTGTFKDREASIIISRCKELGLDNLVFYSTGNTGRAYTHFAAQLGLTTYFFMPKQCHYKNTDFIKRNDNNFIILVDDNYPHISPYAKRFAQENGLTVIAPLHDRTESYATTAYEQFQQLPRCDYFSQTIASGMGPLGFYKGHLNLVRLGLESKQDIPRIVCIQSSEMNVMSRAYNSGRTELTPDDLPKKFEDDLFEPTLNSTNPVNNYPDLYRCLQDNNGIITDVEPPYVLEKGKEIVEAFNKRGISLRTDLEHSVLIGFAGLVKVAEQGVFKEGETILMMATGRGKDDSTTLLTPDATIDPKKDDPVQLYGSWIKKTRTYDATI